MFRTNSDLESVMNGLLGDIRRTENAMQTNLRIAAQDAAALIADRVQQRGGDAEGGRMSTRARIRLGVYSKRYAEKRQAKGRQVGRVDLTMNGDLFRNWQVLRVSPSLATVGFLNSEQADIAGYLETYYGVKIFKLNDLEERLIIYGIENRIAETLFR